MRQVTTILEASMAESKLPPGPWRAEREPWPRGGPDGDHVSALLDAGGRPILYATPEGRLAMPREVLRAVEALPGLIEAARKLMSWVKVERRSGLELPYSVDMCVAALGDALARVDATERPDDLVTNTD
jgi:hypothetical protein